MLTKVVLCDKITESGAKARCKMDVWPVGQAVKTEASHAFNIGSIPVRVTIFSSKTAVLPFYIDASLAQSVRAPDC